MDTDKPEQNKTIDFFKYEETNIPSALQKDSGRLDLAQTRDTDVRIVLDALFPVIATQGGSRLLRASAGEVTPFEVNKLLARFEDKLRELEEEQLGFSDLLRSVHNELFLELIRQEIVVCPERGALLARIQKEALQTIRSMQKLYQSCLSYATTMSLLAKKSNLLKRNEILELKERMIRAGNQSASLEEEWSLRKIEDEEKENIEDIEQNFLENHLTRANQQMTIEIENILDPEKKWFKD